jgi:hypothetical protein
VLPKSFLSSFRKVEVDLLLQAAPLIQARRALLEVIYAGAFAFLKPWP